MSAAPNDPYHPESSLLRPVLSMQLPEEAEEADRRRVEPARVHGPEFDVLKRQSLVDRREVLHGPGEPFGMLDDRDIELPRAVPVTLANTPAFSSEAIVAQPCEAVQFASASNFAGTGAEGPRYLATLNGVIKTFGGGRPSFWVRHPVRPRQAASTPDHIRHDL
jgi:hypothetical protein